MEGATGANASGDKTPPFLKKLLELLKSEEFRDFIDWTDDGRNIIVRKIDAFSSQVLPRLFKHSNFQSFVRQLNMYDFHTVSQKKGVWRVFHNPLFMRSTQKTGEIRRKIPPSRQRKSSSRSQGGTPPIPGPSPMFLSSAAAQAAFGNKAVLPKPQMPDPRTFGSDLMGWQRPMPMNFMRKPSPAAPVVSINPRDAPLLNPGKTGSRVVCSTEGEVLLRIQDVSDAAKHGGDAATVTSTSSGDLHPIAEEPLLLRAPNLPGPRVQFEMPPTFPSDEAELSYLQDLLRSLDDARQLIKIRVMGLQRSVEAQKEAHAQQAGKRQRVEAARPQEAVGQGRHPPTQLSYGGQPLPAPTPPARASKPSAQPAAKQTKPGKASTKPNRASSAKAQSPDVDHAFYQPAFSDLPAEHVRLPHTLVGSWQEAEGKVQGEGGNSEATAGSSFYDEVYSAGSLFDVGASGGGGTSRPGFTDRSRQFPEDAESSELGAPFFGSGPLYGESNSGWEGRVHEISIDASVPQVTMEGNGTGSRLTHDSVLYLPPHTSLVVNNEGSRSRFTAGEYGLSLPYDSISNMSFSQFDSNAGESERPARPSGVDDSRDVTEHRIKVEDDEDDDEDEDGNEDDDEEDGE